MAELVWKLVMMKAWMCSSDILLAALGLGQLDLDAVDTVHTVDEQNQYEDERNLSSCKLHPANKGAILKLPSCHIVASL